MGYSKSIQAVRRVENFLEAMRHSDRRAPLVWNSTQAERDAYYIREGIYASSVRAVDNSGVPIQPYFDYSQLISFYTIRAQNGQVIARPRSLIPIAAKVAQSLNVMVLGKLKDELEIIGAAMTHRAEEMHFPDAIDPDLDIIYNWTSQNGYNIVSSVNGVLLTTRDVGEAAWTP